MIKKVNEFERKFLLATDKIKLVPFKTEQITQIYLKDGSRFRTTYDFHAEFALYELIKKEKIQKGYNVEVLLDPHIIYTEEDAIEQNLPYIKKIRRKYKIGDLTYEIDSFLHLKLVVLEVELPSMNSFEMFELPSVFEDLAIADVTDASVFSNRNLAELYIRL